MLSLDSVPPVSWTAPSVFSRNLFFLSGYSEPFKKERDLKKDFSARHEISTCVSVHARVTISACVLEEIEGGFIINQSPSLSVRAAHTPWLND